MVEPPNISYTLGCASWTTVLFLTYFYVICDLLLNRRMRNEESISSIVNRWEVMRAYWEDHNLSRVAIEGLDKAF